MPRRRVARKHLLRYKAGEQLHSLERDLGLLLVEHLEERSHVVWEQDRLEELPDLYHRLLGVVSPRGHHLLDPAPCHVLRRAHPPLVRPQDEGAGWLALLYGIEVERRDLRDAHARTLGWMMRNGCWVAGLMIM